MLLKIENLKVSYGKCTALDIRQSICIDEGDRVGIIGSNGAGKSTFIKSILGLVDHEGEIETALSPQEIATHMQFNEYTDSMATKYIMEAILQTRIAKDEKLKELISYFEFEPCLKKKYSKLSGGQKQRFTIIMVMMMDAPLTFYDEVTSGLDFETRQKLMEKLVEWYRDRTQSLCIVSHYYEELERLANKLLILDQGKVIDYGRVEELFAKYVGRAVIVFEDSEKNREAVKGEKQIHAPKHFIALPCDDMGTEKRILEKLLTNNVSYKRSTCDIEMLYINAKESYYAEREVQSYVS